ncbi:MAG TPA: serine hydrolase domain-containing protein [Actinocatenispora sp.]
MGTAGYADVRGLLSAARDARLFSGAAWSVGTADGPVERGTLGTLATDGAPVADDTLWDLASVTKPIVGLAALALVERGALGLDDTVGEYLPDHRDTDQAAITVRQLLTHTSGLPGRQPLFRLHRNRSDLVAALAALPLRARPGTAVEYSSAGFMVLGRVLAAASGLGLAELVAGTVTGPVGMSDTGFRPSAADRERCAATEDCPWRGRVVVGTVHDENAEVLGGVAGHAGLFGTHADLAGLGIALLRNGFLSPRTIALAGTSHTDQLGLRRGLGWQCRDAEGSPAGDLFGPDSYGHTGFTGTSLWIDPTLGRYAVLLTNRVHPSRHTPGFDRIRSRFHTMAAIATP